MVMRFMGDSLCKASPRVVPISCQKGLFANYMTTHGFQSRTSDTAHGYGRPGCSRNENEKSCQSTLEMSENEKSLRNTQILC